MEHCAGGMDTQPGRTSSWPNVTSRPEVPTCNEDLITARQRQGLELIFLKIVQPAGKKTLSRKRCRSGGWHYRKECVISTLGDAILSCPPPLRTPGSEERPRNDRQNHNGTRFLGNLPPFFSFSLVSERCRRKCALFSEMVPLA
ncbi:hypothetical protein ZHAS_00021070 [Anopheles sinensis]|uniref:Uncharacterized protein n=1 Tax=Anopheles sinensis TaxID=74873 RepID=A0A084WRF8_ANOSI|nr:hypothetical protein ZHAS_00021070 [Anopheles sinensis]